jgi:hypothetical protein
MACTPVPLTLMIMNMSYVWCTSRYKEPFYKLGKEKERTPGYCDRVLYTSLSDELRPLLQPESIDVPLHGLATAEPITQAKLHQYNAVNGTRP